LKHKSKVFDGIDKSFIEHKEPLKYSRYNKVRKSCNSNNYGFRNANKQIMNKKLLIIQNIAHEGPGLLWDIIKAYQVKYDLIDLSKDIDIPPLEKYKAVVIFGGPDSANDSSQKIRQQLKMLKVILEKNIAFLGICLGFQLLAKAAGGDVLPCQNKETGLYYKEDTPYKIFLTKEAQNDPIFSQEEKKFNVFQLHGETIELNKQIRLLARGEQCANQFIKVGKNAYGIQSHVELTPQMLDIWLTKDKDLSNSNHQQIKKDFLEQYDEYRKHGLLLFSNFLRLANFI